MVRAFHVLVSYPIRNAGGSLSQRFCRKVLPRSLVRSRLSMILLRRFVLILSGLLLGLAGLLECWVQWGSSQNPQPMPMFTEADAIVVLGGGDRPRWKLGLRMSGVFPKAPVIVTGDGGDIFERLLANGVAPERMIHEDHANSTVENAKFTAPILAGLGAHRVVLVTNWFHAPRCLTIFRKYQPDREFVVSYSAKSESLPAWADMVERRERRAVIHNFLFNGVWPF